MSAISLPLNILPYLRTAAFTTLAVVLLTACSEGTGDGGGTTDTNGTNDSQGGVLSAESAVAGARGSVVLAVDGALPDNDEVPVLVEVVPLPTQDASLSADVEALGETFALSSDRPVRASPATPFFLGLPLPEDADPDQLSIAVLDFDTMFAPPDGDDVTGLKREWAYLDAVVDTQTNLVISPLLGLTPEPMIAVVVQSAAFDSRLPESMTGADFEGTCGPGFTSAAESCTATDRSAAASMLEESYYSLTLKGFTDEPHLKRGIGSFSISQLGEDNWSATYVPGPYQIQLRPSSDVNAGGMYSSSSGRIWLAIDTNGVNEDRRTTVRHEYVHATQYAGFDGFTSSAAWLASRWVIEGQAVVAQASFNALERDDRNPRTVDTTLKRSRWNGSAWDPAPSSEYMAQDFWWYLIQRFDADISLLQPFMDLGMEATDVDATLRAEYPDDFGDSGTFGGLPQAYWDWVKNQVFEKGVDMEDARFGHTCEFTAPAATPSALTYVPNGANGTVSETLRPLTAKVVQATFPSGEAWGERLRVTTNSEEVRSTVYHVQTNGGTLGCIDQEDTDVQMVTASEESQTYFVVIANTSLSNDRSFTVAFDGTLSASITSPEDDTMYGIWEDEAGDTGHTVTFNATGSSPQEGSLAGESLSWKFRRTNSSTGSSDWIDAGTGSTVDIFFGWNSCSWQNYDVRMTATDSQGLSASDTISVSIQPPVC